MTDSKYSLAEVVDSERFGSFVIHASSNGRPVTILRLPRDSLALSAGWQQQVQTAVQLRHPHIQQVQELFLDQKHLNVVLGPCTGGSLQQYVLQMGGRLSEEQTRWLFQQLVLAVDYLHSMRVVGLGLENTMLQVRSTNRIHALPLIPSIKQQPNFSQLDARQFRSHYCS